MAVGNVLTGVKSLVSEGRLTKRLGVEITIGSSGEKINYRCRQMDRSKAIKEVSKLIEVLEKEQGRIIWKFTDEDVFRLGGDKTSKKNKFKKVILSFFELD